MEFLKSGSVGGARRNPRFYPEIDWITFVKPNWVFKSDLFKSGFENYRSENWLIGNLNIEMECEYSDKIVFNRVENITYCKFIITPEIAMEQIPKKIFLSHKGIDKPLVRRFKTSLESIGLDVWLDEDAMHAGVELERGLIDGFKKSCAAVFFITQNYKDEGFLATEINYAVAEKREKLNRFSIITLVFKESNGNKGEIPPLLKQYVWKEPSNDLESLIEIIKAIPLRIGLIDWK